MSSPPSPHQSPLPSDDDDHEVAENDDPDVDDERVRGKEDQVLVFASYVRHRTPRDGGPIKETNDDNERRVMKTFVETATRDEVTCSSWPLSSKLWWR